MVGEVRVRGRRPPLAAVRSRPLLELDLLPRGRTDGVRAPWGQWDIEPPFPRRPLTKAASENARTPQLGKRRRTAIPRTRNKSVNIKLRAAPKHLLFSGVMAARPGRATGGQDHGRMSGPNVIGFSDRCYYAAESLFREPE